MLEYTLTRFDICITPTRSQDFPEFTEPEVEQNLVVTQVRHVLENILQLLKRIKTCNKKTFLGNFYKMIQLQSYCNYVFV